MKGKEFSIFWWKLELKISRVFFARVRLEEDGVSDPSRLAREMTSGT